MRFFACFCLLFLFACDRPEPEQKNLYKPASFQDLPNWSDEKIIEAKSAWAQSCHAWAKRPEAEPLHANPLFGTVGFWQSLCARMEKTEDGDLRALIESTLKPVEVLPQKGQSLLTGYYQPHMRGSWEKTEAYTTPLLQEPQDLIRVNLQDFNPTLTGRIVGRVEGRDLKPYHTRQHMDKAQAIPLLWLQNPMDAFTLHIQGSGSVTMQGGQTVHVAYAGNNGHPYTAIGRVLKEQGHLIPPITMPAIHAWLQQNPTKQEALFNQNARYIFFKIVNHRAPGTLGVPLTPEYSLAVDPTSIPLGLPVFIDATRTTDETYFQKLMMAQDTGSAIKGAARGDIYFGQGEKAALYAGKQQSSGRFFALIPR